VANKEVTAIELAEAAVRPIEKVNPVVNAVAETYPDRIDTLDAQSLGIPRRAFPDQGRVQS
jgi:hypothetical protein